MKSSARVTFCIGFAVIARLALTFVAVFVEVSCLVWCLWTQFPIWYAPAIAGAFHVGGMLARRPWFLLPRALEPLVAAVGVSGLAWGLEGRRAAVVAAGAAVANCAIQRVRKRYKILGPLPVWREGSAKVLGMLAGSLAVFTVYPLLVLAVGFFAALCMWGGGPKQMPRSSGESPPLLPVRKHLLYFEVFHQAHYFTYVYVFWWLLDAKVFPYVGVLFVVGWIVYLVLEWFLEEKARLYHLGVVAAGHILCAAALAGMLVFSHRAWIVLVLWGATGLGGGTCYTVRNIKHGGNTPLFDDVGHLLGCSAAAGLCYVSGRPELAVALAALLAVCAAVSVVGHPLGGAASMKGAAI